METDVSTSSDKRIPKHWIFLGARKELVAKDAHELSKFWKITPALLYFMCAFTGYTSSMLFYILWMNIFDGNCPIWAELLPPPQVKYMRNVDAPNSDPEIVDIYFEDWRRSLVITYEFDLHCKLYFSVCLCSCFFGVLWIMLFWRCITGRNIAQWLVIPPAIIFHLIFTTLVIYVTRNFDVGYMNMMSTIHAIASYYMDPTELADMHKDCQLVQYYMQAYDTGDYHDICQIEFYLKAMTWTMTVSWIIGLTYLILRVIFVHDFKLRYTRIYRVIRKRRVRIREVESNIEHDDDSPKNNIKRLLSLIPKFCMRSK